MNPTSQNAAQDSPQAPSPQANEAKAGKNQFKCFVCRGIFANKDGDWHDWDQMQVHLCRTCDKTTKSNHERGHSK